MTMRCTGFCQPNSTIDEKVHRRHDQPDFREMNGRGEREKKQSNCVDLDLCWMRKDLYLYIVGVICAR